jgi:hypothetical protein
VGGGREITARVPAGPDHRAARAAAPRPVLELSATYLGAAFEEANRQYGSFGRFLGYGLEVSEAMLAVGDEPAVHLDHERGGAPAAQLAPLPLMVAAGDELVDDAEVPAADRQVSVLDGEGQTVVPAEQDFARGPEVDHGRQPEPVEPFGVGAGQLAEGVAAEQPAADHLRAAHAAVAADVPHVHRAVEGDLTRPGPLSSHRTRPITHRLTSPQPP